MSTKPSLLLLEDEEAPRKQVTLYAEQHGYSIKHAVTPEKALEYYMTEPPFTVMIVDLRLGREDRSYQKGWEFVRQTKRSLDTLVVIFTGHEDPQTLTVPYSAVEGRTFVLLQKGKDEQRLAKILCDHAYRFHNSSQVISASKKDKELRASLPLIAASGLPVLITGGTGLGKEWVAQELAERSLPRSEHHRIHTVNCATLTETFAIAMLFGWEKGAYTGATNSNPGILRRISGQPRAKGARTPVTEDAEFPGVLILDELAELPSFVQAQLLRALQQQPINALGDTGIGYIPHIRVIACTNDESLDQKDGGFRQDLLGRLDGWHLRMGNPTERKETFVEAARLEALAKFSMTLEHGKASVRIVEVDDSVDGEVEARLAKLRFGFRELKAWVGRACALALGKGQTRLTDDHMKEAWERRMQLAPDSLDPEREKKTGAVPIATDQAVAELRLGFEKIVREAHDGKQPLPGGWTETLLYEIADKLKLSKPAIYYQLVRLKKAWTTRGQKQKHYTLYHAITNVPCLDDAELKRFFDRIKQHIGDSKEEAAADSE
jgi:DNA-binding NtrC family response regulator